MALLNLLNRFSRPKAPIEIQPVVRDDVLAPIERVLKLPFGGNDWALKAWESFQNDLKIQRSTQPEAWENSMAAVGLGFLKLLNVSLLNTHIADEINESTDLASQAFRESIHAFSTLDAPLDPVIRMNLHIASSQILIRALMVASIEASSRNNGVFCFVMDEVLPGIESSIRILADAEQLPVELAQLSSQYVEQWLKPERAEELSGGAPKILSLMTSAAQVGIFPAFLCDDNQIPNPHLLGITLRVLEAGAMNEWLAAEQDAHLNSRKRTAYDYLQNFQAPALRLGATLTRYEGHVDFLLYFSSQFGFTHESAPFTRRSTRYKGDGCLATYVSAHWLLKGAIDAKPSLINERDERGHTVLSLFNEALVLSRPQTLHFQAPNPDEDATSTGSMSTSFENPHPAFKLAEQNLCTMLEKADDVQCIIPTPDPLRSAASEVIRQTLKNLADRLATPIFEINQSTDFKREHRGGLSLPVSESLPTLERQDVLDSHDEASFGDAVPLELLAASTLPLDLSIPQAPLDSALDDTIRPLRVLTRYNR